MNLFDFEMTDFVCVCSGNSQNDENYSDCELLAELREKKTWEGKKLMSYSVFGKEIASNQGYQV